MRIVIAFADFTLDLADHVLYKGSVRVGARRNELRMLVYLVMNAPRVISRRELHESVMGYSYDRVDIENIGNSLAVAVHRVRNLLGDRLMIETIKGEGFRFNGEVQVTAADLPSGSRVERDGEIVYRF